MAVLIGKRKRLNEETDSDPDSEDEESLRARFQKAFEAKFKPLPPAEPPTQIEERNQTVDDAEDTDQSDWDGIPDDDGSVEIIDHHISHDEGELNERLERKSFMSSKPPTSSTPVSKRSAISSKSENQSADDEPNEKANLKKDLALQRLLKESHLLDPSSFSGKVSVPEGRHRLKALDLRTQDLGAKQSISTQQKMPLSHRRGISTKSAGREDRRRKEATNNGVILEKAKAAIKSTKRRERSVGGPTVGKFKGGTLKLSSRDLKSIQGPRDRALGRRNGRR